MLFPERPITVEHVRAFCSKFNESYRVEYKSTFDANVRDKIPKVLSSFANSHGGVLVVGVNTLNGVPQPPFDGFQPHVIEVDESTQAPHAIENSKKVYVRTGNAANPYDLADVDLIFDLAKRRKEPLECQRDFGRS